MHFSRILIVTFGLAALSCSGESSSIPSATAGGDSGNVEQSQQAKGADLGRLRGAWSLVDAEYDGAKQKLPEGGVKWSFQDDKYETMIAGKRGETWKYTLNTSKKPKTIDAKHFIGEGVKTTQVTGIYELDGDNLRICYNLTGVGYPKEFSAPKASRRMLYIFKREGP